MNPSIAFCDFGPAKFLIFGENVANLVYYSHLPIIIVSIIIAFFILKQNKSSLPNQILSYTLTTFALWVFLDSVFWASNRSDVIMFVWSVILLIEPLVYLGGFYLLYSLIEKQDLPYKFKLFLVLTYLPLIIFVPTKFSLSGFDLASCLSIEGPIALYYTYGLEAFITLLIIGYAFYKYRQAENTNKKEILIISLGVLIFLIAFAWGNIIGSFTENWKLGQIGLLGMPIFASFLAYSIVKFHTFNTKLLSAQALITALWILVPSILFIRTIETVRIIVIITSFLLFILGAYLIRSVKREVKQREQLEILSNELSEANEKLKALDQARAEFISIASHQLRTPPATVKWSLASIISGEYGKIPKSALLMLKKTEQSNNLLISLIEDILNVSRIERGTLEFLFEPADIINMTKTTFEQLEPLAKQKGLEFTLSLPSKPVLTINVDKEKLRQVMNNLIDNAIKYTPKGKINVSLEIQTNEIIFKVKDSGKGIQPEEKQNIFQKFTRGKESIKHSAGLGLGLYVAKIVVEQHKGKIWAESEGENKGATFAFSFPMDLKQDTSAKVDLTKTSP